MKLELALLFVTTVLVSTVVGQDLNMILRLMGADPIPLPPTPPKSLFPQLYQSRQQVRLTPQQMQMIQQQMEQKRRDMQETAILRRLQSLSPQQLKQLQDNLTPDQLQKLVSRIQYLKQRQATQATQKAPGANPTSQNTIDSFANRVRTMRDPNALNGLSSTAGPTASRPRDPFQALHEIQSHQKKVREAAAAGCVTPMGLDAGAAALAFRSCSLPAARAMCAGMGGQCVPVGVSVMCCPLGYNKRVLDMVSYMRKMDQFMQQIS